MIYYLILFVLFFFSIFDLSDKKNKAARMLEQYLYFVAMLILIFFAGLRFDTGWDYKGYHYYYDLIPTINQLTGSREIFSSIYFEPGFKFLMSVAKTCGLSFYAFQFLVSAMCILLLGRAIKNERNKLLFAFVYFSTCYLFLNMSVIRQGIAVVLLYLSITALFSENKKIAISYLLVGSLFHLSLCIMIPIALIVDIKRINNRYFYFAVLISVSIYIFQISWLKATFGMVSPLFPHEISYKIFSYLDSERFGRSRDIGLGLAEKIVTFVTFAYIYKRDNSVRNLILLRLFIFYMITYFAFYEVTVLYDRLRLYFVALNVFVYVSIFGYFSGFNKVMIYFIIIFYSVFSYINVFRSDSNRLVFMPYYSVLENENTIPSESKGDLRIDRAIGMDH